MGSLKCSGPTGSTGLRLFLNLPERSTSWMEQLGWRHPLKILCIFVKIHRARRPKSMVLILLVLWESKNHHQLLTKRRRNFARISGTFEIFGMMACSCLTCLPRGSSSSSSSLLHTRMVVSMGSTDTKTCLLATTTTKATSTNIAAKLATVAIPGRVQVANPGRVHWVSSSPSLARTAANPWRVH